LASALTEALYLPSEPRLIRRLLEVASLFGTRGEPAAVVPLSQEALAQLAGRPQIASCAAPKSRDWCASAVARSRSSTIRRFPAAPSSGQMLVIRKRRRRDLSEAREAMRTRGGRTGSDGYNLRRTLGASSTIRRSSAGVAASTVMRVEATVVTSTRAC